MDKLLIYLLSSNTPHSEVEKLCLQESPYTQWQLAEMIMKDAEDLAKVLFVKFKDIYEDLDFTFLSVPDRTKRLIDSFSKLKEQKYKTTWNNITQVKANLIADIEQMPPYRNQERILWTHMYDILIESSANELILHKKKEYLISALSELQSEDEQNEEINIALEELTDNQLFAKLFPKPKPGQLSNFINALSGKGKYPDSIEPIIYVGTLKRLWHYLAEIRKRGYKRRKIADIFSENCLWKANEQSLSQELLYKTVYKNC